MSTQPNQAMPHGGDPEGDAKGQEVSGEARRGDPSSAPRPLGRKDPTLTGDNAPDKEGVPIRE